MATRSKQDGTYTRTATDLEHKYNFGKTFAEVYGLIDGVKQESEKAVNELDARLDPEEIFNRLTNYGKAQGIYRDDDGNVYVNASYIKGGTISADYINVHTLNLSGVISFGDLTDYEDIQKQIDEAASSGGYSKSQIKTFISDELVLSPTIAGADFFAYEGSDTYANIDDNGFYVYRKDISNPKVMLGTNEDASFVYLVLGAGSRSTSAYNNRLFVQKGESMAGIYYYDEFTEERCGISFLPYGEMIFHGTVSGLSATAVFA